MCCTSYLCNNFSVLIFPFCEAINAGVAPQTVKKKMNQAKLKQLFKKITIIIFSKN